MSSEKKPRRKFTAEYKADVVRLCQNGDESVGAVCRRLGISETAVRRWIQQGQVDAVGGTPEAITTDERQELARLRRENHQLRMEREILKKATAFFAKENS